MTLLRRVLFTGAPTPGNALAINLTSKTLVSAQDDPADSVVGIRLLSDGTLQTRSGTATAAWQSSSNEWAVPRDAGNGDEYEARMLTVSGAYTTGSTGWLPLNSTRTWEILRTTVGSQSFNGTLEIRRNGVTLASRSISMLAQVVGPTILLTSRNIFSFQASPNEASAGIRLLSDGTLQTRSSTPTGAWTSVSNEWATPRNGALGATYEARMLKLSGANPIGAINTWLVLNNVRSWDIQTSDPGQTSFEGTLQIRRVGGSIEASANINLDATVESGVS